MRLALLGDPVAHSLSPALHAAALRAVGLPGTYVARRVDTAGLRTAVADLRDGRLDGANVTMPHKRRAAACSDLLDPSAVRTGAVNTLTRVGNTIVGHNTDVDGVRHAWRHAALPVGDVTVLGAGGAAAAAMVALAGHRITLMVRRPQRGEDLIARTGVAADVRPWEEQAPPGVLVNATPLGMAGETLPGRLTGAATGVLDMAYGHGQTPLATTGRTASLPVAEGPEMLLGQALACFRLWTGREAPPEVMRNALDGPLTGDTGSRPG